jgi:hypothetical protein
MTFAWQTMISNSCLGCGTNFVLLSSEVEEVATTFVSFGDGAGAR